jgi:GAF domain-containing protein
VIELLDQRADSPADRRDMELLGLFAGQAALAIESSRVFSSLGQALFQALGMAATGDRDLAASLDELARRSPGPTADLAELAGAFARLGRVGPAERVAATRLIREFLAYAGGDGRPP